MYIYIYIYIFKNFQEPYNKPDNKPLYINVKSNHPPNIIENLPESISRRINKLSSDKIVFHNSKELFNNALFNSGFEKTEDKILYGSIPHTSVM